MGELDHLLANEIIGRMPGELFVHRDVAVQVVHVRESPVVQAAAARGVKVHGWIHDVADGLLRDLMPSVDDVRTLEPSCRLPN